MPASGSAQAPGSAPEPAFAASGAAQGSEYKPPSSPAYTSATKLPPPRAGAGAATTSPPPTPGAHLAAGGDGAGGSGKGGRGWVIAAVVLVIALVGGGAAFVLLGDDDKGDDAAPTSTEGTDTTATPATDAPGTSAAEPVDVAQAFFAAGLAGDCRGMAALLTQGSLLMENDTVEDGIAECEQTMAEGTSGFEGMTVGNVALVSVDGDVAIVSVDFDIEGQASTEQFHLKREDGTWKMDLEADA